MLHVNFVFCDMISLTLLSSLPLFLAYDCEFYNKGKSPEDKQRHVLCVRDGELCGLKQLSACSSGERTFQADRLQGQVDASGGQQLRRLCVPGHQHRPRSPVTVHGDAWPQQSPSSRCVSSVPTSGSSAHSSPRSRCS